MDIYIGSYTQKLSDELNGRGEGISYYTFDAETIDFTLKAKYAQRNPAYLAISTDGKYLYAAEELFEADQPHVFAYKIAGDGQIELINSLPLEGSLACHLAIYHDHLIVANYGSGNILVYPIDQNGGLKPHVQNIEHKGSGPNKFRQESPHAHMVLPIADGLVYVPDLGIDQCKAYRWVDNILKPEPDFDLQVSPGSGPRHMVYDKHRNAVYVIGELSGDLYAFDLNGSKPTLVDKINTLPASLHLTPSAAAIRIHPEGNFLYVSNRDYETVTVVKIQTDSTFKILQIEKVPDVTPRDINVDPKGKLLFVAGMDSDSISIYEIDRAEGWISHKNSFDGFLCPTCIAFG